LPARRVGLTSIGRTSSLEVDIPKGHRTLRAVQIHCVQADGSEVLTWTGEKTGSFANRDPVVCVGQRGRAVFFTYSGQSRIDIRECEQDFDKFMSNR